MGETEATLQDVMAKATAVIQEAEIEIRRLQSIVKVAKELGHDFPCSCWINKPKCSACQLLELTKND